MVTTRAPSGACQLLAAVAAAVVGNDDLAGEPVPVLEHVERALRDLDAVRKGATLVEARHHEADVDHAVAPGLWLWWRDDAGISLRSD